MFSPSNFIVSSLPFKSLIYFVHDELSFTQLSVIISFVFGIVFWQCWGLDAGL
jgi:hypothetical protein